MIFENILYWKWFTSWKKYASNPLGKRPGHLVMNFDGVPCWKCFKSLEKYVSNPWGTRPGHLGWLLKKCFKSFRKETRTYSDDFWRYSVLKMLQILKAICSSPLGKRPGHLEKIWEDIPYWKCFRSLRKYALNPLGKRPGHQVMNFKNIPYWKCFNSLSSQNLEKRALTAFPSPERINNTWDRVFFWCKSNWDMQ